MSDFFEEISFGQIYVRDKYQLELKSEYSPNRDSAAPPYSLEFYIFIPPQLQVHPDTYSKKQFYRDQLSLLRYKTPVISLQSLLDLDNPQSPLTVLANALDKQEVLHKERVICEIKLLANMIRGQIRIRSRKILHTMKKVGHDEQAHRVMKIAQEVNDQIASLCADLDRLEAYMVPFFQKFFAKYPARMQDWVYIDEFLSFTIEHYLCSLLQELRKQHTPFYEQSDQILSKKILHEEEYRKERHYRSLYDPKNRKVMRESILRMNRLTRYIFDVLFLSIQRKVPKKGVAEITAAFAAGLAMFIYLTLLAMQGNEFLLDSSPFIIISVLLYIVKDRLKESVRKLSTKWASQWFADYVTDIVSKDSGEVIGRLKEYMDYIDLSRVPQDIMHVKRQVLNPEFEAAPFDERVIYYRKEVEIFPDAVELDSRLEKVNDIFRYNLWQYFVKASDVHDSYPFLNPETGEIDPVPYDKTYTLHLIIKRVLPLKHKQKQIYFDSYRVVIDKEGIRSVEKV